jgi:hypothetical protein
LISAEGHQLLNFLCNQVFDESIESPTKTQIGCGLCNLIKQSDHEVQEYLVKTENFIFKAIE